MSEAGRLCHWGRIDSQVKIRGQRVELSEIETSISQALAIEMAPAQRSCTITSSEAIIVELITLKNSISPQPVAFLCVASDQPLGCFLWQQRDFAGEAQDDVDHALGTSPEATAAFAQRPWCRRLG